LIAGYPLKSDGEILAEAGRAYEAGAFRHCLVFSGYSPSLKRIEHLAGLIREIKKRWPMEICVSPGVLDKKQAGILKEAGLDRLNHNLNTSERHYSKICTTHTFQDRLNTIKAGQDAGLELCSGIIVGMGEGPADIVEVAGILRDVKAASIRSIFFCRSQGLALSRRHN